MNNVEIRKEIFENDLKKYMIAQKIGITCYTFSKWLQTEMSEEQKQRTMRAINVLKGGTS